MTGRIRSKNTYNESYGIRKQVLECAQAVFMEHTTCRILQIAYDKSYRINQALYYWRNFAVRFSRDFRGPAISLAIVTIVLISNIHYRGDFT